MNELMNTCTCALGVREVDGKYDDDSDVSNYADNKEDDDDDDDDYNDESIDDYLLCLLEYNIYTVQSVQRRPQKNPVDQEKLPTSEDTMIGVWGGGGCVEWWW